MKGSAPSRLQYSIFCEAEQQLLRIITSQLPIKDWRAHLGIGRAADRFYELTFVELRSNWLQIQVDHTSNRALKSEVWYQDFLTL